MSARPVLGLAGCGLVLLALTAAGLYAQNQNNLQAFVAIALGQGAVYLLALRLAWRGVGSRQALAVILTFAAVMRIAVLLAPPFLSTDIYRYVWDGRVLAAGINPYRYIPTDPHLAALRDPQIFPNINRNNYAHTIYPPAAEAIFWAVTRASESLVAMKAAMVLFEATAVVLLLRLLIAAGGPPSRIAAYAWHPLPLWEFAGSGHIDAAVIAFIVLALWSRVLRRPAAAAARQRGWAAGIALAGGTLVKFYPAALFPALWRRWDWRMPTVFGAALVLAYLPFVGVGWGVFGFLPHYAVEEGFAGGGAGFYLWNALKLVLPLAGVSPLAYVAAAGCLLAGLAIYVAFRPVDANAGAALLAGAVMLLLSPHYAWYFAWLVVFACLVPSASLVWLTLASFLLYLVPVGSQLVWDRRRFLVETALYGPFLVLAATDLWRHRRREQARNGDNARR